MTVEFVRKECAAFLEGAEFGQVEEGKVVITCNLAALPQQRDVNGSVETLMGAAAQWAAITIMPDGVEILNVSNVSPMFLPEIPATTDKIIITGKVVETSVAHIDTESTLTYGNDDIVIAKWRMNVLVTAPLNIEPNLC
ncbi:MAG: hypothetical protein LBU53_03635 [Zoogloeaceae bacterium]|nr:hypothetical protein [Zoogloeaceae bacterium]